MVIVTARQAVRYNTHFWNACDVTRNVDGLICNVLPSWLFFYEKASLPSSGESQFTRRMICLGYTTVIEKYREWFIWLFSSIVVMLCITNSFRLAKLWTRNIIWALCAVCVKQLEIWFMDNSWILHHDNAPVLVVNFWQKIQQIRFRIHVIWQRVTFSCFLD